MANIYDIDIQDFSILLVEPSMTQRKIIKSHLENSHIRNIDDVPSVEKALDFLSTIGPPDLIISSMYFDKLNGVDFIKQVKAHEKYTDIPFILLSSENKEDKLEDFRQAGVIALLNKPFTTTELTDALAIVRDSIRVKEIELEYLDVSHINILVVDDSKTSRNYIKHFLYNMGFNLITEASSAHQAIELLYQNAFDLCILDQEMPKINGMAFAKRIHSIEKFHALPIIMITSGNIDSLKKQEASSNIASFFQKPMSPCEFRKTLKKILD